MKSKLFLSISALIILISPILPVFIINSSLNRELYPDGLFVGVTADGDVTRTKLLIDKVKSFTNFIIINNPDLMRDKNSVDEVCDYAKKSGMNFFVHHKHPSFWQYNYDPFEWIHEAETKYGNNFLGVSAGCSNTIGCRNNFVGSDAGVYNTEGSCNNFLGNQSGYNNTTGSNNNFFGHSTGSSNTSGSDNNFIGN